MNQANNGTSPNQQKLEVATLGGGCIWCLEPVFDDLRGVVSVVSGYAGGSVANPSYEQVCTGRTGHAEVVQVTFDSRQISYADLLRVFFSIHDPTTLNRQGADVGTQYRSIILYHSPEQKQTAEAVIRELGEKGIWNDPIVTQVVRIEQYYEAEDFHQESLANKGRQAYCTGGAGHTRATLRT